MIAFACYTFMIKYEEYPGYSVRQIFQDPWKISCKIMHFSCRKMQDCCKKYQFLARILKGISGLMKFLQDMSGSWNISTFLYKAMLRKQIFDRYFSCFPLQNCRQNLTVN